MVKAESKDVIIAEMYGTLQVAYKAMLDYAQFTGFRKIEIDRVKRTLDLVGGSIPKPGRTNFVAPLNSLSEIDG